ncbi:MAG: ABC transporter ATP-binding protein [Thiotrichaceae bacterium]|nr:ABC transporter ATP-binding protein [Thiotrichaceae bacterium]
MTDTILEVKDLSLRVGDETLLDNVSFTIKKGEVFSLVGESGSGKSLTSLAIMRLLPDVIKVSSGDVTLYGKSLFSITETSMQRVRGKSIAMIFQEPLSALNPVMTVGKQVAEALQTHLKLEGKAQYTKVIELMEEVGLKDSVQRYHWYPHQLSGGQKQRIMIAMALACEPELLVADEPTTALDVTVQARVLQLLNELRQTRGLSILFITHDMGVVAEIADRIAVMKEGKIIEQANKEHFFTAPEHPYTKKLLADALPQHTPLDQTEMHQALLEVNNLKVYYPIKTGFFKRTTGHVKAVDGVSLTIRKGETLALVGESGSGKSTIGKAVLRLEDSQSGEMIFDGINLLPLTEKQLKPLRRHIQVIFQDPYSALNPRMTIGNIIREGIISLSTEKQTTAQQDKQIAELLEKVELKAEFAERYPHEFSGGQRQRIGIARALAVKPKLIICDEPTSALDVSVRAKVLRLLRHLQKEEGLSYLFITHDLSIIPTIAHQVAVMKEGKIVEQGSLNKVVLNPQHAYTQQLLNSAPKMTRDYIKSIQI